MTDADSSRKLTWVIWLLVVNVAVMIGSACAVVFGLLPKVERAVQAAERAEARFRRAEERFEIAESRFRDFADEVQPVLTADAARAIETIEKIDPKNLPETATETAGSLIDAAAERASRFLLGDKEGRGIAGGTPAWASQGPVSGWS